jgi:hypothetical protein
MGSWNDIPAEGGEYRRLTRELYVSVTDAIAAAVNTQP